MEHARHDKTSQAAPLHSKTASSHETAAVLRAVRWTLVVALLISLGLPLSCATTKGTRPPQLIYSPKEFRAALLERVPEISDALSMPPFEVAPSDVAKAKSIIRAVPLGQERVRGGQKRVRALVASLSVEEPAGFGLKYDWLASSNASRTLSTRRGNCIAFASVLVGLGRELGWPIYYAEAQAQKPETFDYDHVRFVSDHMVVIVVAKTVQMVIDFSGQVEDIYDIKPIDDLTAYAHLINNVAGQRIAQSKGDATTEDWESALSGFELANQIQPKLGRAWNNRGIALTRLGRFDEAEKAYQEALSIDAKLDSKSARHNLALMKTRASGQNIVAEEPVSR